MRVIIDMRLFIFLLIPLSFCEGRTVVQIKDFICGCEYCETVNTGEPLDIGRHMIMCHSWREATLKTMEIMRASKKPKLEDKNISKIKENKEIEKTKIANEKEPNKHHHRWSQDNAGTWTYSDENYLLNNDGWLYREDLGWLWSFNKKTFLYSEHYGWLYNYLFDKYKIYYWYDRRAWMTPRDLLRFNN